jgi:hypothetical protein
MEQRSRRVPFGPNGNSTYVLQRLYFNAAVEFAGAVLLTISILGVCPGKPAFAQETLNRKSY